MEPIEDRQPVLSIMDEAQGVDPAMWEAAKYFGTPLPVMVADEEHLVIYGDGSKPDQPYGTINAPAATNAAQNRVQHSTTTPQDKARGNKVVDCVEPYRRRKRVSRNQPCPCGSGRKFKSCCLPYTTR